MATDVILRQGNAVSRPRPMLVWLGWAFITALAAYFFATTVPNYFRFDAVHYRYYWPARWWLVAHIGGGSLALWMGPLQFSTTLRKRFVKAHRWMGRLYLCGILVGSLGAMYMGFFVSPNKAFGIALEFLALAWFVTSGMAYLAVMRRQFVAHKEWMIRSYVVTFGFVLFRLGERWQLFGSLGSAVQPVMLVWVCWAIPVLGAEVALQWRRTVGFPVRSTP
ncbi:MAG: DUF2306 domain-containing protein [Acidobacteriota bacterium]|nr:DUF2306 domain-containing protein [Acidobacteriota bacterium]